jgi:hypothetical protein
LFIQSFVENEELIFYEMGYRLSGALEYKIISAINGLNPMEMLINFAITASMHEEPIKPIITPNYSTWGCILTYLVKPGEIGKIIGIDQVRSMPGVIEVVSAYDEGKLIAETAVGRLQQVVLRVFVIAKTQTEMAILINNIHNVIKVLDAEGKDMLLDVFETKNI